VQKLSKHDSDILANSDALTAVELKFRDACEKERLSMQAICIRQTTSLEQHGALEEKVAKQDAKLQDIVEIATKFGMTALTLEARLSKTESEQDVICSDLENHRADNAAVAKDAQDIAIRLQDLSNEMENKVDIESSVERDERRDKQLRDVLQVSEDALQKRQQELQKVADAFKLRDRRIDGFSLDLRRMQAEMEEESRVNRDVLQQWVVETRGGDASKLADFSRSVDAIQASIAAQTRVQSQHTEWIQELSKSALTFADPLMR
jgi:hypothetical protein